MVQAAIPLSFVLDIQALIATIIEFMEHVNRNMGRRSLQDIRTGPDDNKILKAAWNTDILAKNSQQTEMIRDGLHLLVRATML